MSNNSLYVSSDLGGYWEKAPGMDATAIPKVFSLDAAHNIFVITLTGAWFSPNFGNSFAEINHKCSWDWNIGPLVSNANRYTFIVAEKKLYRTKQ